MCACACVVVLGRAQGLFGRRWHSWGRDRCLSLPWRGQVKSKHGQDSRPCSSRMSQQPAMTPWITNRLSPLEPQVNLINPGKAEKRPIYKYSMTQAQCPVERAACVYGSVALWRHSSSGRKVWATPRSQSTQFALLGQVCSLGPGPPMPGLASSPLWDSGKISHLTRFPVIQEMKHVGSPCFCR